MSEFSDDHWPEADRHSARRVSSRRIRISRLRLTGQAKPAPAWPCTEPPRFIRYLRYAVYTLALAIVAAVTIEAVHLATRRPPEGQAAGLHDRTSLEAVESREGDLRGPRRRAP